jgi:hypothetical protein
VYPISDWAILNDTKSKQLERILAEFHHLSESEITLACVLLESYHAVYRRDRLRQRRNQVTSGQARMKQPCAPPTPNQLQEIVLLFNAQATLNLRAEEIANQLQDLAKRLREYRRYVRTSLRGTASLDQLNHRPKFNPNRSDDSENNGYIPFLQVYSL